jgi:alpha-ketoglutarate-dependent taurine dioxygenase
MNAAATVTELDIEPLAGRIGAEIRHVDLTRHPLVRVRYRAGDVVIWDNQATQHYAIDDYGEQPRRVQRVTLIGDVARSIDGRTSETLAGDPSAYLSIG